MKITKKNEELPYTKFGELDDGDAFIDPSGMDDDTVIVEFGNNKNCRIPMHKKAIAEVESADAVYEEEEDEKTTKAGKKKND